MEGKADWSSSIAERGGSSSLVGESEADESGGGLSRSDMLEIEWMLAVGFGKASRRIDRFRGLATPRLIISATVSENSYFGSERIRCSVCMARKHTSSPLYVTFVTQCYNPGSASH